MLLCTVHLLVPFHFIFSLSQALKCLKSHVSQFPVFKARHLHLSAYMKRLENKASRAKNLLTRAHQEATECGSALDKEWVELSRRAWFQAAASDQPQPPVTAFSLYTLP